MDTASPSPFFVLAQINETSGGKNRNCYDVEVLIFAILSMFFCVLGMLGNGLVIWLVGPSVKKNTFAIYIINLSVADFGLLTTVLIIEIHWLSTHLHCDFPYELFQTVLLFMYTAGQFLPTVISIDRCISVLFPIWYRCHRPVHVSTTVCAVIWVVSFILSSIHFIIVAFDGLRNIYTIIYPLIISGALCLPLTTISTVVLLVKICFMSKSQRRRKVLTVILVTLFFFLVLAFPLNAFYIFLYRLKHINPNLVHYGYLCICINSSTNPLIYYLVGRQKGETWKSIKELFQKLFKEEELY